jgi:hypothetical protein
VLRRGEAGKGSIVESWGFSQKSGRDSLAGRVILRRFKAHANGAERGGADSRDPDFLSKFQ